MFYTLLKIAPHKPSKLIKINCNYVVSYYDVLFTHVHSCLSPSIPACMLGSISGSMQYEQDDPRSSSPAFFEVLSKAASPSEGSVPSIEQEAQGHSGKARSSFLGMVEVLSPLLRVLRG